MAVRVIKAKPTLRRYTELAAAIHVLQTKSLTIRDPKNWDDGNDKITLDEYKTRRELKSVLAMCFAECAETYHHWKVFAPGMSGVCIEFKKAPLVSAFDLLEGVQHRKVVYRKISLGTKLNPWSVQELPFLKRWPYEPETEYRVIYCSADEVIEEVDVDIELGWIDRIILSPWMPKPLHNSVRTALRRLDGCSNLTVQGTSLISSDE
ncbi:hypothetical protein WGT02_08975 [Rhizobium sp. T1470]|uniref:hypothetical protein n=1 Tax=unclassified Rhizobium TaxID=2613769 RepID=UPI001AAF7303|nr:hypothetical protein [Rhizobium sp. T1473]MCA0801404.1 hypothetical protein [Rhizobium sp. T1473]